ncbi:MAG: Gfo/Idh/MocA family oxidoreductase, partial [Variovorax sp.]
MSRGHSAPRSPLRVGLVGAGWVTPHHLAGWQQCRDRASVVAIADPDRQQAEIRAREYGIKSVYDSAERMLDDTELDALDIAAPRQFHAQLVRLVADRGLAVLCQKPLAPNFSEAQTLVDEVASKCRLMVHENWR